MSSNKHSKNQTNSNSSNGINTAVTPPYYPSSANAESCTIRTGEVNELHLDKEGIFPLQALRLPEEDLEEDYTEAVLDDTYKKQATRFVVRRTTHNKLSKYSNMRNATKMLKRVHLTQGTSGFVQVVVKIPYTTFSPSILQSQRLPK